MMIEFGSTPNLKLRYKWFVANYFAKMYAYEMEIIESKGNEVTAPKVFLIEGLDRLGKSTLIQGIIDTLGFYDVIHYSKPRLLSAYSQESTVDSSIVKAQALYSYQRDSFRNMAALCQSPAKLIFDRAHLGEYVYAPLYRGYSGDYVFDIEREFGLDTNTNIRLILLTEALDISTHFTDDGQSLGPAENRKDEQVLFAKAFYHSTIKDKRIICVTDPVKHGFRPTKDILAEALA